ncbi:MAG: YraN family protein [Gammaproteobacteria bacterium RIFCSPHIGHO2_12_FULL_41_20]|nr:MAG: YraN family protein [Gammaproteobacteria bacterium RIFCSPHIGHO2_12_FULL_41_20]
MDKLHSKSIGQKAEEIACRFLLQQGLQLLKKNYTSRYGEIDLILQDRHDVIFVEVRNRNRIDYGNALESVTKNKQKKIIRTAFCFLQKNNLLNKINCRFDIIAIKNGKLEWIKNAFSLEYC